MTVAPVAPTSALHTPPALPIDVAVGQMVVAGFGGNVITPGLRHLILDDKVGGVILFTANCGCSADGLGQLVDQLRQLGRDAALPAPLLVTIDQEGGTASRAGGGIAPLPDAFDLGRQGAAAVTTAVSRTAGGLASAGVTLDLAPVADLRTNPDDAVIGDRSFGSDPARVGPLVAAYIEGLHQGGVASTVKHFPGLGGAPGNPHNAIATDPVTMDTWMRGSAQSFAAGIAAGTDAVMTTAVYVPGLDAGRTPAMLSRPVVTGLLRQRLRFSGVIVTDSLSLGGLQAVMPMPQSIVAAAAAGNDLLLLANSDTTLEDRSVAALQQAVASGTVSPAAVEDSAQRVISLRMRYPSRQAPAGRRLSPTTGRALRIDSPEAHCRRGGRGLVVHDEALCRRQLRAARELTNRSHHRSLRSSAGRGARGCQRLGLGDGGAVPPLLGSMAGDRADRHIRAHLPDDLLRPAHSAQGRCRHAGEAR
ncbi:MAG: hypothetical protein JF887_02300 [Candidatus Dormibacteraeota bacterium]|uniref:beta-N-acetylhexosaminidase n=1 Tax=Candidatus Amunia macphersoniae TaxID=3127014 RepID=A0A934KDA0_9BACT|nr:hypothetical protein [Candidatus Dormibacteraeota bacterium]